MFLFCLFLDLDNAGVKAVITLGVLAVVGILAFIIAKVVQYCVNKHYTDDDGHEIDENTRALIRARLSVVQFKKREIKKAQKDRAMNIFTKWKELVKNRKKDREEALKHQRPQGNGQVVITIDKTDASEVKENGVLENEKGKIQENGTPRIQRFPSFAQTKTAGEGVKPSLDPLRANALGKTNTVKPDIPVPRGRPVSSKHRNLPNVVVREGDVNNTTKITVKSVHFEDDTGKVSNINETNSTIFKPTSVTELKVKGSSNADSDTKSAVAGNKDNVKNETTGVNKTENINIKSNANKEKKENKNVIPNIDVSKGIKSAPDTDKVEQVKSTVNIVDKGVANKSTDKDEVNNMASQNNENENVVKDTVKIEKETGASKTNVENRAGEKT